ncbi:MAG: iron-sulfur cluster assembly protein [Bacteroidales bacterium]
MSKVDEQEIREALRQVVDPELGANVVDLKESRLEYSLARLASFE